MPLAGLEPARYLYREILRHMRQKLHIAKATKIRTFSAKNLLKMPQNQCFPFVTKSLKSATSQNFPNFFTKMSRPFGSFCIFNATNFSAYSMLRDLPRAFQDNRRLPSLLKRLLLSYH